MEVDASLFWSHLEDSTVDLIFERLQRVLLSLKQKIKDRTATEEECCQAFTIMKQVEMTDLSPLINVNVASEEDIQKCKSYLHPSASSEVTENPGNVFSLRMETREVMRSSKRMLSGISLKVLYQDHTCSKECLAKRPWNLYKGENPLHLPLLCHFQRRHAKADAVLKSLDVIYRAPCGKSLRNFQEVQNYLFQTECSFLFLDHFSFNTYVQVFRNSPNRQTFEFDFDISKGAETVPVSFCNDIDHNRLPYFKYRKTSWPHGYFLNNFSSTFLDSCSCMDGCTDRTKCACLRLTERRCREASGSSGKGSSGYSYKRLDEPVSSGIYECNLLCSCDKIMCQNRLVQHGVQVRLQVFNTEKKGWGVRCLDDIDKGTFVCTYSGRLMSRGDEQVKDGGGDEVKEEDAENSSKRCNLLSRKRKIDTACSDSEIEFIQTGKQKYLHIKPEDEPDIIQDYSCSKSWHNQTIRRSETRTSILQNHQRQLGVADASSDEDENSLCQKSARRRVTAATQKGHEKSNLQREFGELVNPIQSEVNTDYQVENPLSIATLNSKPPMLDEQQHKHLLTTTQAQQDKHLLWIDKTCKEKLEGGVQASMPNKEAMEDNESCLMNKESPCLLDATREGNVGRFLNHSCSPNLFVQSVFVETHNRNFPWVAFFTNRHVKAGTELTWDYGYEAGSMPETETTCHCGAQKCRKKIL